MPSQRHPILLAVLTFAIAGALQAQPQPEPQISAMIVPNKKLWKQRDTIRGVVLLENTSKRSASIHDPHRVSIAVRREDGTSPPKIPVPPSRFGWCGGVVCQMNLPPGQKCRIEFRIETDPLGRPGDIALTDGRYELFIPDLTGQLGISARSVPVPFEVRTPRIQDRAPRILDFAVGGDTIVVVRENGEFSAHDLDTGKQFAAGRFAEEALIPTWYCNLAVSADGGRLALVRHDKIEKPTQMFLFALNEPAAVARPIAAASDYPEELETQLRLVPSAGPQFELPKSVEEVEAQSLDGTLVALRLRGSGIPHERDPLAIWSIDPPKELLRLADHKPRRVRFTNDPTRVVSGFLQRAALDAYTLTPRFEIRDPTGDQPARTMELRAAGG